MSIPTLNLLIITATNLIECEIDIKLSFSIHGAPYLLYEIVALGRILFNNSLVDKISFFLLSVLNFDMFCILII